MPNLDIEPRILHEFCLMQHMPFQAVHTTKTLTVQTKNLIVQQKLDRVNKKLDRVNKKLDRANKQT